MQQTEAYTVRSTNLYNLYKYLQHFILFHIFHLLTEKQRECRTKENQVQVPLPSKASRTQGPEFDSTVHGGPLKKTWNSV